MSPNIQCAVLTCRSGAELEYKIIELLDDIRAAGDHFLQIQPSFPVADGEIAYIAVVTWVVGPFDCDGDPTDG